MSGWMDGTTEGWEGGRSLSILTMCQRCYFPHHRTRLDTNNGMYWQLLTEAAGVGVGVGRGGEEGVSGGRGGKWATANLRLCKSIV